MPTRNLVSSISISSISNDVRSGLRRGSPFSLFMGAGCSLASDCSSYPEIIEVVLKHVLGPDKTKKIPENDKPKECMEVLSALDSHERVGLLREHLYGQKPGPAHLAMAKLVAMGYFTRIFTTNFDTLIEEALNTYIRRPEYQVLVVGVDSEKNIIDALQEKDPFPRIKIAKLHGSLDNRLLLFTPDELAPYRRLLKHLAEIALEKDLLCIGYSFSDPDLPLLEISSSNRIYWVNPEQPTSQLEKRMINRYGPDMQIMTGPLGKFTSFFEKLEDEMLGARLMRDLKSEKDDIRRKALEEMRQYEGLLDKVEIEEVILSILEKADMKERKLLYEVIGKFELIKGALRVMETLTLDVMLYELGLENELARKSVQAGFDCLVSLKTSNAIMYLFGALSSVIDAREDDKLFVVKDVIRALNTAYGTWIAKELIFLFGARNASRGLKLIIGAMRRKKIEGLKTLESVLKDVEEMRTSIAQIPQALNIYPNIPITTTAGEEHRLSKIEYEELKRRFAEIQSLASKDINEEEKTYNSIVLAAIDLYGTNVEWDELEGKTESAVMCKIGAF